MMIGHSSATVEIDVTVGSEVQDTANAKCSRSRFLGEA